MPFGINLGTSPLCTSSTLTNTVQFEHMIKYQLLRSNKQSGPFGFEELKAMGLKPFDLIWVEGKSFSWRYPSEVDELKSIAPTMDAPVLDTPLIAPAVVSVQPTPSANEISTTAHVYAIRPRQNDPVIHTIRIPEPEAPKDPAPRIIVEEEHLPQAMVPPPPMEEKPQRPQQKEEKKAEVNELYIVHSQRKLEENNADEPGKLREPWPKDDNLFDKKFSDRFRAVNETRLPASAFIPAAPKRKRDLTDTIMFGFIALAMLVTGYMIGTYFNGNKKSEEKPTEIVQQKPVESTPVEQPTSTPLTDPQLNAVEPATEKPKPAARVPKKEKKADDIALSTADQQVKKDVLAEDQKAKEASQKEQEKAQARTSIYQNLVIKTNDYRKVFLGGITDLRITVSNTSKYIIDEVVVEVSYLKNNKELIKNETVKVQNLLPGAEATVVAPDSKRGARVDYRILQVKSRELGM